MRGVTSLPPTIQAQAALDGLVAALALKPIPAKKLLNSLKAMLNLAYPTADVARCSPILTPHHHNLSWK